MGDGGEQLERIRSDKDKGPIALSSRETDRPGLEDKEDAAMLSVGTPNQVLIVSQHNSGVLGNPPNYIGHLFSYLCNI